MATQMETKPLMTAAETKGNKTVSFQPRSGSPAGLAETMIVNTVNGNGINDNEVFLAKPAFGNAASMNSQFNSFQNSNELSAEEMEERRIAQEKAQSKNKRRLWMMLIMVLSYCMAEVFVGYSENSLALVADSFHMLSDALSLVVALYGIKLASRGAHKAWSGMYSTYGWGRSEVLTTLINGVFLVALCLTILLSAIERLVERESVKRPELVFWVGTGGLLVNVLGLVIFGGHSHSHGGGGGGGHHHEDEEKAADGGHGHSHDPVEKQTSTDSGHGHSHDNMNMHAVFLHILGDFLGSVVVMVTSGTLWWLGCDRMDKNFADTVMDSEYSDYMLACRSADAEEMNTTQSCFDFEMLEVSESLDSENHYLGCYLVDNDTKTFTYLEPRWTTLIDPVCSLILVAIIITMTLPVVQKPIMILLQTIPDNVDRDAIRTRVLNVHNVEAIHCLHIWQMNNSKNVGSLHVVISDMNLWAPTLSRIEQIFRNHNVSSLTVQPEVLSRRYIRSNSEAPDDDSKGYRISQNMQKCWTKQVESQDDLCCENQQIVATATKQSGT